MTPKLTCRLLRTSSHSPLPPPAAPRSPNCVARTAAIEGTRRIFLYSGPAGLSPGEELTYDYKLSSPLLLDTCKVGSDAIVTTNIVSNNAVNPAVL